MEKHYLIPSDKEGFPIDFNDALSESSEIINALKSKNEVSFLQIPSENNKLKERWKQKGHASPMIGIISEEALEEDVRCLLTSGESFRLKTYDRFNGEQYFVLIYSEPMSIWPLI